jgi:uncharacterized membrane protein YdjX (TVP38/TMEM64 family)
MMPSVEPPNRAKWLIILLSIALIGVFLALLPTIRQPDFLQQILTNIQQLGWRGPIVFIGIYILATVLLLPASVLTLGAGALFGLVLGSVYTLMGATLGSILAFFIGRYLARDWVQAQIDRRPGLNTVIQAVVQQGFKIVLLTRLSPVFPFSILNYVYGVTDVSWRDYAYASIGMIPGTVMYVYIGSLAGSLATLGQSPTVLDPQAQLGRSLLQGLGLVATIGVTLYVTRLARQALKKYTESPDAPNPPDIIES